MLSDNEKYQTCMYTMVVRLSKAIYRIKTLPQGISYATTKICLLCLQTHMEVRGAAVAAAIAAK